MSTLAGPRYDREACNAAAIERGMRPVRARHNSTDPLDTHWSGYLALPAFDQDSPEAVELRSVWAIHDWYVNGIQGPFPAAPEANSRERGEPIDGDASARRWARDEPHRIGWFRMDEHPYWEPSDDRGYVPADDEDEDEEDAGPVQLDLFDLLETA